MVLFADNSTPFQRPGLPADRVRKIRIEPKPKKDGEEKVTAAVDGFTTILAAYKVKVFEDEGNR